MGCRNCFRSVSSIIPPSSIAAETTTVSLTVTFFQFDQYLRCPVLVRVSLVVILNFEVSVAMDKPRSGKYYDAVQRPRAVSEPPVCKRKRSLPAPTKPR